MLFSTLNTVELAATPNPMIRIVKIANPKSRHSVLAA